MLNNGVALVRIFKVAFAALQPLCQHGGQPVDPIHTKHQIDIRVACPQLVHDMLLLRHAAANADDEPRIFFLELFQRADVAEHPLLCMLAHRTGVE